MNKKCLVVGISGPTTAGKTTISELIKDNFDCPIIHEDHFFNYERVFKELGGNREIPEAIDSPKFVEVVKKEIASGQHSLLLVQGFQMYHQDALVELLDVRIFLEIDDETIHQRRMKTNKCTEQYFQQDILKNYHIYRDKAFKVENLLRVDSSRKIVEVYKQVLKHINEAKQRLHLQ